jgi:hypothetical protein
MQIPLQGPHCSAYVSRSRIDRSYDNSIFFFFFFEGPPVYFLQGVYYFTFPSTVNKFSNFTISFPTVSQLSSTIMKFLIN